VSSSLLSGCASNRLTTDATEHRCRTRSKCQMTTASIEHLAHINDTIIKEYEEQAED
jgi:hypothetical protein